MYGGFFFFFYFFLCLLMDAWIDRWMDGWKDGLTAVIPNEDVAVKEWSFSLYPFGGMGG